MNKLEFPQASELEPKLEKWEKWGQPPLIHEQEMEMGSATVFNSNS